MDMTDHRVTRRIHALHALAPKGVGVMVTEEDRLIVIRVRTEMGEVEDITMRMPVYDFVTINMAALLKRVGFADPRSNTDIMEQYRVTVVALAAAVHAAADWWGDGHEPPPADGEVGQAFDDALLELQALQQLTAKGD